ncbi:MAG TPA: Ig domain-containing protein [Kofleriaceae bacterium]|nr:Ig domain-containing protein [Kofleriaceae bacterium]
MRAGVVLLVITTGCGRIGFSEEAPDDSGVPSSSVALSYPSSRVAAVLSTTMIDLPATVSGTNVQFSVFPALPSGITLDTASGRIAGIPTAVADEVLYVITATNGSGSASASLTITALPGFVVDQQADVADDDAGTNATCFATSANGCTLRAAVQTANTRTQKSLVLVPAGNYVLGSALGNVTADFVIAGQGSVTIRPAGVHPGYGLFVLAQNKALRFEHITALDFGTVDGAIVDSSTGTVAAFESRFINNAGNGRGGAFFVHGGELLLDSCYFSQNTSNPGNGWGGVINGEGANTTITVRRSTAEQNAAPWGSFSHITAGTTLTLENSTLHHNTSSIAGTLATPGGVYFLRNNTIVFNTNTNATPDSAAIYLYSAPCHYTIENTLVAFNTDVTSAEHNCHIRDVSTSITSNGGNLFSDTASDCQQYFGSDRLSANPQLDATVPANHGGLNDTYLLASGSPAIDTGTANCPTGDERGMPRPSGQGCDIGAVEMQ